MKLEIIKFDLPDILNDVKKLYEPLMFDVISKREQKIIDTLISNTKIKQPISCGKLRWHGIRMAESPSTKEWWIEQRGVMIGSKYRL